MKKSLLIALFSLSTLFIYAQGGIVKVGMDATYLPTHEGSFFGPSLAIETPIGRKFGLNLQTSYGTYVNAEAGIEKIVTRGFTFNPEVRFFTGEYLHGLFVGLGVSYTRFSAVLKGGEAPLYVPLSDELKNSFIPRLAIGYQANLTERITLNTDVHLGVDTNDGEGVIGIGLGIGYKL